MKVINKTNYDTRYLRSLFIKCEKHEGTNHKYRVVYVESARTHRVNGWAWISSRTLTMRLPKEGCGIHSVAGVYIHEVGHNQGLRHDDMIDISRIDLTWLIDESIPLKATRPQKPKPNIVEVRAVKAQKKLDGWLKKLNRAKTFIKKYQRKVRYYEKKKAASK